MGRPSLRAAAPALATAAFYYIAVEIGTALALSPVPMPHLRPGSAVVLAALLINPARLWWAILLAILPVHLFVQLQHGVPLALSLVWLLDNWIQALLGAAGVAWLMREPLRFGVLRHAVVFVYWCGFLAPAVAALPEVALQSFTGGHAAGFWETWAVRVFAGAAVVLTIVPLRVSWPAGTLERIRDGTRQQQLEAAVLVAVLLALGALALQSKGAASQIVALVTYAPLPLLFWTAIRFRPFGAELAFLLFAAALVAATASGAGPFAPDARAGGQLLLPLFLAAVAVPMLLLSAALQERRGTLASLQREQEKLGQALAAERKRAERLARERRARAEVEQRVADRTVELRHANDVLCSEVAARKKALEAEQVAAARFSNLFRLSPDAMALSRGVGGALLDVNDCWQQLFGFRRDEVLGQSAQQLGLYTEPGDLARVAGLLQRQGALRDVELRMHDRHGRALQVLLSGVNIANGGDPCFLATMRDVTAQRRAEAEVRRQREELTHLTRVVVLGELSGALAHELNQPLAAILTNAQAARRFLARDDTDLGEIREILGDIVEEDKRAGEVIRRLRALYKKEDPVLRPVCVGDLVREVLEITHGNLVERNVSVQLHLQDGLVVQGDRVQLQQVLLNLIVNACDAMRLTPPDRRQLRLASALLADGRVQLTVADSGPGIAPDAIGKVFDPFFTTKAEGLGFGLSISRAIVVQHGGQVDAVNNPAGGCSFRIWLPAYGENKR
jgi:PAS domain S-box-containing protein